MLKLCCPTPITRHTCPVVRPCLVSIASQTDHRLDGEGHARLASADSLVLRIVWNIRCGVECAVDAMTAVRFDDRAAPRLGMLFDDVAEVFERHAGLHDRDCLIEALSRSLDELDEFLIRQCFVANVVGLVQIAMVAFVVQSDIEIEDISIQKNSLVRNAMAYDFIW